MGDVVGGVEAGGPVVGVMTEHLVEREVAHHGLTTLEILPDMHTRKARMAELADGVIVLPGGFGTLDETFELLTWNQLGIVSAPVVFLDNNGYFDALFDFVQGTVTAGFVKQSNADMAQRAHDANSAVHLASRAAPPVAPKWI